MSLGPGQLSSGLRGAVAMVLVVLVAVLAGCSINQMVGNLRGNTEGYPEEAFQVPKGHEVLWQESADLDADGDQEKVYLLADKSELADPDNPYTPVPKVLAIDSDQGVVSRRLEAEEHSYWLKFPQGVLIRDITGKGDTVIGVLTDPRGNGGKGITFLSLFRWAGSSVEPITVHRKAHPSPDYEVVYVGGGYYRVTNQKTGTAWILGSPARDAYQPDLASVSPWFDPEYDFQFTDTDQDGRLELVGRQILVGMAHADILADLVTLYAWDGEGFVEKESYFTTEGGTQVRPVQYDIPLREIYISSGEAVVKAAESIKGLEREGDMSVDLVHLSTFAASGRGAEYLPPETPVWEITFKGDGRVWVQTSGPRVLNPRDSYSHTAVIDTATVVIHAETGSEILSGVHGERLDFSRPSELRRGVIVEFRGERLVVAKDGGEMEVLLPRGMEAVRRDPETGKILPLTFWETLNLPAGTEVEVQGLATKSGAFLAYRLLVRDPV